MINHDSIYGTLCPKFISPPISGTIKLYLAKSYYLIICISIKLVNLTFQIVVYITFLFIYVNNFFKRFEKDSDMTWIVWDILIQIIKIYI